MSESRARDARSRWRRYLRFWGPDINADIDDELRYHIEMRMRDFMAAGRSEREARSETLRIFGDPRHVARALRKHDARKLRHERRTDMLQDLAQDVRYGARKLAQAPRFTAAVAIVLALGIGANTAVFSVIDAAFLRPLPFFEPERLVAVTGPQIKIDRGPNARVFPKSAPDLDDYASMRDVFTHVAGYATGGLNLVGGAEAIRATVTFVTADFLSTLGRVPAVGRPFSAGEMTRGGPTAVILSYALWQREFGGDRAVIGRRVTLNDVGYEVVGVMGPGFTFPVKTDLWIAMPVPAPRAVMAAFRNYMPAAFIGRLAPGIAEGAADLRVEALIRRFRPTRRPDDDPIADLVIPLQTHLVGDTRTAMLVLMGSAGLLLLIACANVTNLLLSRAATRRREIAVRVVLGATRVRVVRQLAIESALLALIGGALACAVAWASVGALAAAMPAGLSAIAPPRIDPRVLGFTMLLAIATSVAFGLWPAIGSSRVDLSDAIKTGGGGATRLRGRGARGVLVVAEVALALMLVVGAGLLLESLHTLLTVDSGIRTDHLVSARLSLSPARYPNDVALNAFLNSVLGRLGGMPGVRGAAAVTTLPMETTGGVSLMVRPEGVADDPARKMYAAFIAATPGYFRALGTGLRGADLPSTYDSANKVVVINRTLANTLWPGEDPVGKRLDHPVGGTHTVIGVVADIRARALDQSADPQVYFPMAEAPEYYASIVARGDVDAGILIAAIREAVKFVDVTQPVYAAKPMEDVASDTVAPRRTNTVLLSAFGLLALLLSAIGVYAVLSYGVSQRTREIGVRVALGARASDVVRLIVVQGFALASAGVVIGLASAYALSRFLGSILYEGNVHDPRVFVAAPLLLLAVACAATWLPARRAARVTPMEALREG